MPLLPLLTTDDLYEIGSAAFDGDDPRVVVADLVDAVDQGRLADKTDAGYALVLAAEIMEQAGGPGRGVGADRAGAAGVPADRGSG